MGNTAKDEALYQEMCRVVGKVVLEMRDLGQEPKHIVIAGVVRTALANQAVTFQAGMPLGIVLADHMLIPEGIRKGL